MADAQQQEEQQQLATFPAPPLFFKDFTPSNIAQIESLRAAQVGRSQTKFDPATSLPPQILDLPPELRCLQPPAPPADGLYRCFGIDCTLAERSISLSALGIPQLYTPPSSPSPSTNNALQPSTSAKHADRAFILKRISKSLLLNYLELIGIMSIDATQYEEKMEDIKVLMINFHHLLNEYRPHQARESLILMMRESLERSKAQTEGILKMRDRVEGLLGGLGGDLVGDVKFGDEICDDGKEEEGKEVWEEVWERFG